MFSVCSDLRKNFTGVLIFSWIILGYRNDRALNTTVAGIPESQQKRTDIKDRTVLDDMFFILREIFSYENVASSSSYVQLIKSK